MGLSHSSSANQPTILNESPISADTTESPTTSKSIEHDADSTSDMEKGRHSNNPGSLPDLHRKCLDLMPVSFGGLKILLNNHVSDHFQTGHLIDLTTEPHSLSGYKFTTTFVGNGRLEADSAPGDTFPVFFGDIDTAGNVNANIMHYVTPRLRLRYNGQFRTNSTHSRYGQVKSQAQMMAEYLGSDYTLSMVAANLNRDRQPEILVGQYLQALTKHLALGTEITYNNTNIGRNVPFAKRLDVTLAGRWETGSQATWSVTWGPISGLQLTTYQKASESLQIGVEAVVNQATKEVVTRLGYQASLPSRHYVFRGMVDSKGTIGSSLEKGFHPYPLTFTISAFINHRNNQFRLGCGIVLK